MCFFPKGRAQQLLWHLAVERSDGWQENLRVGTAGCPSPFPCDFFLSAYQQKIAETSFPVLKLQGTDGHSCFKADQVTLDLALHEGDRKADWFCVLLL